MVDGLVDSVGVVVVYGSSQIRESCDPDGDGGEEDNAAGSIG